VTLFKYRYDSVLKHFFIIYLHNYGIFLILHKKYFRFIDVFINKNRNTRSYAYNAWTFMSKKNWSNTERDTRSFFRCLSPYLSAAHQFDLISLSVNALRFLLSCNKTGKSLRQLHVQSTHTREYFLFTLNKIFILKDSKSKYYKLFQYKYLCYFYLKKMAFCSLSYFSSLHIIIIYIYYFLINPT